MKTYVITLCSLLITLVTNAQGIKFEESLSWKQIKEKAKQENKYILMDAYATWCIPCKEMDANTFPIKDVGDFVNERFVAVKVQMDQTKNDPDKVKRWQTDAKDISKTYEINAFPTILVFTSAAELAGKILGFRGPNELIAEAKKIIKENENFEFRYQQYLLGKNDSADVKSLVLEADKIGRSQLAHKIAQDYINNLPDAELFKEHNLLFVFRYTTKSTDKGFSIFRNQGRRVNKVFPTFNNPSKGVVDRIIYKEEIEPFTKNGNVDWKKIVNSIKKKYGALDNEYYYGVRMAYASENKLWQEFGKYYALYFKTAASHSAYHINNISWSVLEHVTDPAVLEIAISTMKYNNEHFDKDNAGSWDTYANLLYKAGRKQEALAAQEKAVQLSKNAKVFVETLNKMKANIKLW